MIPTNVEDAALCSAGLYRDLQQLRETIVQEHVRLSALHSLLRTDGSKVRLSTSVFQLTGCSYRVAQRYLLDYTPLTCLRTTVLDDGAADGVRGAEEPRREGDL